MVAERPPVPRWLALLALVALLVSGAVTTWLVLSDRLAPADASVEKTVANP